MLDWDRANPPLVGPNWMVPMEAAIRIVNWIWGYFFMADSPSFTPAAASVFYRNLLSHGRFIMRHLEAYGNHRFSNFVGLIFLGVLFPEFKEAAQWREIGLRGFYEELTKQVRADGCHFEGSIPYHRLVLEMAATTCLLLRRNGIDIPGDAAAALSRMFAFTAGYLKPNGFAPQVGDADDGRLQELTPLDKRDHAYLLALGAVLTETPELKASAKPHPEAFWLLGPEGLDAWDALPAGDPPRASVAFKDSGFVALRSERLHAFVTCRRPDAADVGAHAHNDHLSFTLALDGADCIVDSGTYTYTGDIRARHAFRSARAHNTVTLDGMEINALQASDPFRLDDRADCRIVEWSPGDVRDVLVARHTGYPGITVERQFILDHERHTLEIRDRISGEGRHRIEWRLHFAPEWSLSVDVNGVIADCNGKRILLRGTDSPGSGLRLERAWYSPSYGVRVETTGATAECDALLPVERTLLFEPADGAGDPAVREVRR